LLGNFPDSATATKPFTSESTRHTPRPTARPVGRTGVCGKAEPGPGRPDRHGIFLSTDRVRRFSWRGTARPLCDRHRLAAAGMAARTAGPSAEGAERGHLGNQRPYADGAGPVPHGIHTVLRVFSPGGRLAVRTVRAWRDPEGLPWPFTESHGRRRRCR